MNPLKQIFKTTCTCMSHIKAEVRAMEKARNNTSAGGSLTTVAPETVNVGDTYVKHKRDLTNHYKPEVFPTKSKRDKTKAKMQIRGFHVVATDPDTKLPRMDRVKFAYTCVVNGKEVDDFTWVTLREIYGDENEEQFVGCLYELKLTHGESHEHL